VVLWVTKVCSLKLITNLEERPAIIIPPAIKKKAAVVTETYVNNVKSTSKFHFQLKISSFLLQIVAIF